MTENDLIDPVLDMFGGADGGVSFTRFKFFMKEICERADNGDPNAEQIIQVVERFNRLIKIGGSGGRIDS